MRSQEEIWPSSTLVLCSLAAASVGVFTGHSRAAAPEGQQPASSEMEPYSTEPTLSPGQPIEGSITSSDIVWINDRRADCYQVHTEPGTRWVVTMESTEVQSYLVLLHGHDCTGYHIAYDWHSKLGKPAKLHFEARGGVDFLIVTSFAGNLPGAYKVRIDPLVGKVNEKELYKLKQRGMNAVISPSGTASTIDVAHSERRAPGTTFRDCPVCPEMVVVPAGTFMMGSPSSEEGRDANEGPRHRVTITNPFAIGTYEVTEGEWNACKAQSACRMERDLSDPREGVNERLPRRNLYFHAMEYVAWLSKTTGKKYFLPSEAEWEYAARAGTDTPWNTDDAIITEDANFLNSRKSDVPVGQYPPNAFGLYDTHGNVAEWVQDCLIDGGYFGAPTDGSAAKSPTCLRIIWGGSFEMEPAGLRSARRIPITPTTIPAAGFRVTRALDAQETAR